MSIVTGEWKCRGIYTDEHQLDVRSFHTEPYPQEEIQRRRRRRNVKMTSPLSSSGSNSNGSGIHSLCEALEILQFQNDKEGFHPYRSPYLQCHRQNTIIQQHAANASANVISYSIAKVEPSQAPTTALESLVLVIPFASDWFQSDFHGAILTFIEKMVQSPWLAKTIMVLSPDVPFVPLTRVVSEFFQDITSMSLPMTYGNTLIRQLVVLEVVEVSNPQYPKRDEYVILSHGTRGIVPNLDLVSAARYSLLQNMGRQVSIAMHPFSLQWWEDWVRKRKTWSSFLDPSWKDWAIDLGHLVAFMAAFWSSPSPPHAPALDHGIDSITIQARLRPNRDRRRVHPSIILTVASMEHLVRGLNSLSERLHHNVNQYLLPSSSTFVSHGEYILPCVLVMLPLAMRVIQLLVVQDMNVNVLNLEKGLYAIFSFAGIAISMLYCKEKMYSQDEMNVIALLLCFVAILLYRYGTTRVVPRENLTNKNIHDEKQSIQLVACMLALYTHVPLALSHVSLFLISALVWVPLLSFVDYGRIAFMSRLPGCLMFLWTLMLVPGIGTNVIPWSRYACVVLAPLNFLVLLLSWM